ncbi:MAG TPA: YceI family protein [Flavobacteriales bacterium]|nr:YceI family protein [Flavobacteriales bacterium]
MNVFLTALIVFFSSTVFSQNYQVTPEESSVHWHAEKVTGEHDGTVGVKLGEIWMKEGKLTGGIVVIDMESIVVTDLQGEWAEKLGRHLKSPDFFGSKEFPTSTLVINKAIHQGKERYKVEATLTIKNISKETKFIANVHESGNEVEATADLVIDRSEFNVRYGSGSFFDDLGDKTIYDDFTLKVTLKAVKTSE